MRRLFILSLLVLLYCSSSAQSKVNTDTIAVINEENIVFSKTEKDAIFPGGDIGWRHYLTDSLNANTPIMYGAKAGTYMVIIRFIVSRDGTIKDVVAETRNGYGMEAEGVRVIKNGPKWIPAMQNGRKVNAYRRQPITFVVQNN